MKNNSSKKKTFLCALFALITVTSAVIFLPGAFAHTPAWNVPTYAYITAAPDPIGVNQPVSLLYWLDKVPPTAAGFAGDRWGNLTIAVTKPDGTKQTLGPFVSDPVGGGYALYTPDQTGTYTFVFNFPGQVAGLNNPVTGIPGSQSLYIGDYYLPSTARTTLTVQQAKIVHFEESNAPSGFWTRPIEGENTNWANIASNYLSGSANTNHFQPDGVAPDSGHIMWTKPLEFGGVVGGTTKLPNDMTFYDGTNYEGKFNDPIILYGRLFYSLPRSDSQPGGFNAVAGGGYVCVDLATGKEIWRRSDLGNTIKAPSFAQLYDYESMNQHGVIPNGYLWSTNENPFAALFGLPSGPTTWNAYDPFDGQWLFNMTGIPSGTEVHGQQGEILRYVLNSSARWLALWNNTAPHALTGTMNPNDYTSTDFYQWRPVGKSVDASTAYSWNVTIPALAPGSSIIAASFNDMIIVSTPLMGFLGFGTPETTTVSAISVKEGTRGQALWTTNIPAPSGNQTRAFSGFDPVGRVFIYFDKETISYTGFSMDTGAKLWGPTPSENPWNFYSGAGGAIQTSMAVDGKLYSTGYSGIVYCYDSKTGALLWNYAAAAGLETPYSGYPLGIAGLADGKLYLVTNEHSSGAPYWKGAKVRAIDITNGKELWAVYGHGASTFGSAGAAIADGYLVYLNLYDMQVYCIGKGPSSITVDGPMTAITLGQSLIIRGMITDKSAGAVQLVNDGKFNTVAAVSDESMNSWMNYVYMQKNIPAQIEGVKVHLTALDPNNNIEDLGYATSDKSGLYSLLWSPPVPGKYTVTATFEGSASYWPSFAETAVGVIDAPAPSTAPIVTPTLTVPPAPTPTVSPTAPPTIAPSASPSIAPPPTSETPVATYVGILVVVIIAIIAVIALMLRRRK